MNKKVKAVLLAVLLVSILFNSKAFSSASEYYTNLPESEVEDIFNLDLKKSISDILTWVINRETYIIVENKGDGSYVYWLNTPNTQTILYNFVDSLLPVGYQGSGIDPWQVAVDKNYSDLMQEDNYTTAQKKFGFNLPSPTYLGEYPRITMSLMGVLVESNPVKFFMKKIGGFLFGGSIISPPEDKTLNTLFYISPNDYSNSNNSFEKWIELYWGQVMESMQDGQILMDKDLVDNKGFDSTGIQWIKTKIMDGSDSGGVVVPQTVGTTNGVDTPRDISLKLQENCGVNYLTVVKNIVLFGVENAGAKTFDNAPKRIMPYQRDTLRDFDKNSLVEDPRADYRTQIFGIDGLTVNFDIGSLFKSPFTSFLLSSAGVLSKWTIKLNKLTNFSLIDSDSEGVTIDATMLWRSPISILFISLTLVFFALMVLKNIISLIKGSKGVIEIFIKTFSTLVIIGAISFISLFPDKIIDITKTFGNAFFNMGSQSVMENSFTSSFIKSHASDEDKIDCSYWVPYFSLWSNYQTSSNITNSSNRVSLANIENEPEQQENPTYGSQVVQSNYLINSDFNNLWSLILAESFTEGFKINNNAYRVVDHFTAPRISYDRPGENGDGATSIISSTTNENFKGKIQKQADIGIYMFVVLIFLAVLVKLLLFLEFIYELVMLQIHLVLSSINPKMLKRTMKEFGAALLRVGLWDMGISILIFMSMVTSGVLAVLLCVAIVYILIVFTKRLMMSNTIWKPKMISGAKELLDKVGK